MQRSAWFYFFQRVKLKNFFKYPTVEIYIFMRKLRLRIFNSVSVCKVQQSNPHLAAFHLSEKIGKQSNIRKTFCNIEKRRIWNQYRVHFKRNTLGWAVQIKWKQVLTFQVSIEILMQINKPLCTLPGFILLIGNVAFNLKGHK